MQALEGLIYAQGRSRTDHHTGVQHVYSETWICRLCVSQQNIVSRYGTIDRLPAQAIKHGKLLAHAPPLAR